MPLFIAIIGAIFLTFAVSRGYLAVLRSRLRGQVRLIVAHALSLVTLGTVAATTKAFLEVVNEAAVLIYIIPQLLWLAADWYAARARKR